MIKIVYDLIAIGRRLAALFGRPRRVRDIDDELAFHLAMRQADHERAGLPPSDARLAARRKFGNVASLKEQTADMWRFPSIESIIQDVRYAVRSLIRTPGFSVVAVLVMALGIGANTAMFSLVDAMLIRALPFRDPGRLVVLIGTVQRATVERRGNSFPDYVDWRNRSTHFDDMAAYSSLTMTLLGIDEPERINVETVSASYFSVFGVTLPFGRSFTPGEDAASNPSPVAVLSDGLWRRRFGADPAIVGKPIRLSGRSYTVVGIAAPRFSGRSDNAELWVPFAVSGYSPENRAGRGFETLARLKAGASIAEAQSELTVIAKQLAAAYPDTNDKRGVEVSPLSVETVGSLQPMLVTLMAAVSLVLLIACTNVANLLVARSDARQREIAVRTALGAGPSRLFRQLVTESCVLTFAGALAGLGLAYVLIRGVTAASPVQFPTFVDVTLNAPVLVFTLVISLACGLLLGLAPAMHARLTRLTDALKESSRGTGGMRSHRLRAALVVAEVAMAIVLFVGAALMIRSGQKLAAVDPGFDPDGVLVVNVSMQRQPAPPAAPPAPGRPAPPPPFVLSGRELLERVRAVPGVQSASLASDFPLGAEAQAVFYTAEGDTTADAQTIPRAYVHRVSPTFFADLRIPLRAGRTFAQDEAAPTNPAVIVSDNVARRFWPNQDPVGKHIKLGAPASANPWLTVIGVVGETKYRGLPANPTSDPDLYFSALERSPVSVIVRTTVAPAGVIGAVRAAIRRGQPAVAVFGDTTMQELVDAQTAGPRFTTWVLGLFASAALLLSVIGIYGVMSYLVAQRAREFSIRLALGASRMDVVRSVLRRGIVLIALGTVMGIVITGALSRLFSTLLFEVTALDGSAVFATVTLAAVATLACVVPAVRATRVDPIKELRS